LHELNRLHLRQILEGAAAAPSDARSPNDQKIGDEYASCMDTAAINKLGLKPLQPELDKIALRLNQRPRKTLEFQTPAGKLQASVASTY